MKKIIIIGANSYIARNMIFTLQNCKEEYELKLYDRAPIQKDGAKNYSTVNILSNEAMSVLDLNCDVIYMFIGKTGSANGFDDFNLFIDANELALLNLLNEYRRQKSKAKIIFPSTRLVYKGNIEPQNENNEKEFKTIYAINKYACEQYLEQFYLVFGVQYCIFRICIPYGTLVKNASSYGTAEFMLMKATKGENITLYGDGAIRRTLTYIGDLCDILINGAFSEKCVNDVFNIGGENYSLKEMAELIAEKNHVGIDYIPWPDIAYKIESGNTVFDSSKLQNALGTTYQMTFKKWCHQFKGI